MERYADWPENIKDDAAEIFQETLTQIRSIISSLKLDGKVEVNTLLLSKAIIDYIEDIIRLEHYSDITSNIAKTYAHSTYWLLRRSPIVSINPSEAGRETMFINEKVSVAILMAKLQKEKNIRMGTANEHFFNLMYYNFQYRLYTQKTLELMIEAYFHGCDAGRSDP